MSDDATLRVGDRAPDFTLPTLDGDEQSLAAARATGPVVVHFVREFS